MEVRGAGVGDVLVDARCTGGEVLGHARHLPDEGEARGLDAKEPRSTNLEAQTNGAMGTVVLLHMRVD
jgi:hypothetical protein